MALSSSSSSSSSRLPNLVREVVCFPRTYRVEATNSPWESGVYVLRAWTPSDVFNGPHQTVSHLGGERCWGLVGTERDVEAYDHLPVGAERTAALRASRAKRALEARTAIALAFPELGSFANSEEIARDEKRGGCGSEITVPAYRITSGEAAQ